MASPVFAAASALRAMAGGDGGLGGDDDGMDSATESLLTESSDGLVASATTPRKAAGRSSHASSQPLYRKLTDDIDDSFVTLNSSPKERDVEAEGGHLSATENREAFPSAHSALVRSQQSLASYRVEEREESTELKAILNRTSSLRHVGDTSDEDGDGNLGQLYSTLSQVRKGNLVCSQKCLFSCSATGLPSVLLKLSKLHQRLHTCSRCGPSQRFSLEIKPRHCS